MEKAKALAAKLLHESGAKIYEIASVLRVHPKIIRDYLKTLGYEPIEGKKLSRTKIIRSEVLLDLWLKGFSLKKMPKLLGLLGRVFNDG